jgi:hypothetical protein
VGLCAVQALLDEDVNELPFLAQKANIEAVVARFPADLCNGKTLERKRPIRRWENGI